ncbi:MAG: glycosyl hydrolase 53 family protein [Bacteroidota bacterium]
MQLKALTLSLFLGCATIVLSQDAFLGADLSYVQEMEACGATYFSNGTSVDPFQLFADEGATLARFRLWHTPAWHDNLNSGQRFSDLADVRSSIQRSKQAGMEALLSVHLSDTWADPSNQLVPAAWLDVVDLPFTLADSVYNYFTAILQDLHSHQALPKIIQIGNETNKGILLSPTDNAVWTLNWQRNTILFNHAVNAIRDFEAQSGESIEIMLHIAGPNDVAWFVDQFVQNGVTDFDWIGISYYWQWHQPATIESTGDIIEQLLIDHPGKRVLIVEAGYPWTTGFNDNAGNILSASHPDYAPLSPAKQADWLIDLTQSVFDHGGHGVVYWEPAWVSTTCNTQWAQGSHYENATFFDFNNNAQSDGGFAWLNHDFGISTSVEEVEITTLLKVYLAAETLRIETDQLIESVQGIDVNGRLIFSDLSIQQTTFERAVLHLPKGVYAVHVALANGERLVRRISVK